MHTLSALAIAVRLSNLRAVVSHLAGGDDRGTFHLEYETSRSFDRLEPERVRTSSTFVKTKG